MMNWVLVAMLIVGACAVATVPRECRRTDCPVFQILESNNNYQLRRVNASTWISASSAVTGNDWRMVKRRLFYQLFGYIRGANDAGERIPMTAPVLTKLTPGSGRRLTMYFMLPLRYHGDSPVTPPPAPLPGTGVTVERWEDKEFYVRSFGGFAREPQILQQLDQLTAAINNDTLYDGQSFYKAGYDRPSTRRNRHNEIWLAKLP